MNRNMTTVEKKILRAVRQSPKPSELMKVVEKVSADSAEARAAREAIRSLVDRGVLQVTLDWKLRAEE